MTVHPAPRGAAAIALMLIASLVGAAGCSAPRPDAPAGDPGTPIPGLSATALARFKAGEALFNSVFGPEQGLGPAFNENQCSACHTSPASGGVGGERVLKATRYDSATGCDLLTAQGGENVRKKVTETARAAGLTPERVPEDATPGRFTAPALYGIGFVDAVPETEIASRADPEDRDHDGISGRLGRTPDGRVGRFGRKGDVASLADFVASALHFEMGLTTARRPADQVQGRPPPPAADPAPDPELDSTSARLLADYVRYLAPPGRGGPPRGWTEASVARGEQTFKTIGCARCHVPRLLTGPDSAVPLDRRRIALYSDLLLHDLGPGLADVCGPGAAPSELRTEMLMGLRYRDLLMHDGRTTDLRRAVELHDGEARAAREAFGALDAARQGELLAFLRTL